MEEGSFMAKKPVKITIIVVFVLAVMFAAYITFYSPVSCSTYECFKTNMQSCLKTTYVNEEPEASWGYNIIEKSGGSCQIEVKLLQAKKGDLGIDKLNGELMTCTYPFGVSTYPEKDLDACSGRLKEDLQGLLIKKLYTYILDNIGQFNKSLNSVI